jgi:hypothetical protein
MKKQFLLAVISAALAFNMNVVSQDEIKTVF